MNLIGQLFLVGSQGKVSNNSFTIKTKMERNKKPLQRRYISRTNSVVFVGEYTSGQS